MSEGQWRGPEHFEAEPVPPPNNIIVFLIVAMIIGLLAGAGWAVVSTVQQRNHNVALVACVEAGNASIAECEEAVR